MSSTSSMAMITVFGSSTLFSMTDTYIYNASTSSTNYISITAMNEIFLTNTTIDMSVGTSSSSTPFVSATITNQGNITADGFIVTNTDFASQYGISLTSSTSLNLSIHNISFDNVTMDSNVVLIKTDDIVGLDVDNMQFSNIVPSDSSDTTNKIFEVGSINLNTTNSFIINRMHTSYTSLKIFSLISNPDMNGTSLVFSNLVYEHCLIEFSNDIILLQGIETRGDFQIIIDQATVSNITFSRGGNIMKFRHQTVTDLELTNSVFSDISSGSLQLNWFNQQSIDLPTKVRLNNVTVTNYDGNSNSFLHVIEGGNLQVDNSKFTGMYNFDSGTVVRSETSTAKVLINNSVFQNNTSIDGGVFLVDDESVLKLYN